MLKFMLQALAVFIGAWLYSSHNWTIEGVIIIGALMGGIIQWLNVVLNKWGLRLIAAYDRQQGLSEE